MLGPIILLNWLRENKIQGQQLAQTLEVSPATVSRWIRGKLIPSKLARIALSKILRRDDLINRWEEKVDY